MNLVNIINQLILTNNSYSMGQDESKSTTFFRFEDLRVYSKAIGFVTLLTEASSLATNDIESHFYKRFLEEATLIAFNIAEGSSKNKSSFVNQLKSAKTNIRKCVVFTTIGRQNDFINNEKEEEIRKQLMELTKMIGALIISLQKNNNNYHHEINDIHESQDGIDDFEENIIW